MQTAKEYLKEAIEKQAHKSRQAPLITAYNLIVHDVPLSGEQVGGLHVIIELMKDLDLNPTIGSPRDRALANMIALQIATYVHSCR